MATTPCVSTAAPSERIYRAFLTAEPPNSLTCKVHELDAQVGGSCRMTFTNFSSSNGHSFGGTCRGLVPSERILSCGATFQRTIHH